ncbi:MAG: FAD:protein transferase [Chitinophagaceae bacterium]|nr:FAD:protein transferase [Chitinophagaceae bacterium]
MQENNAAIIVPSLYRMVSKLMGNRFEISVVTDEASYADECIEAAIEEIRRIEKIFTTFNESSQTNLINRNAGLKPVKVEKEMFDLIRRSKKISEITQGAFDITYGSLDKKLWNFDQAMTSLPDHDTAKKGVRLINYNNVLLDEKKCTVFLREKGMRIGFGGIAKGYAADRAKLILLKKGINSGIVNAAGDLTAWGHQPGGRSWTIGIADPNAARNAFSYLDITNSSVATSGNYEKFVVIDGKKYSHTINPKTGLPIRGIKSVTIIGPNAELADAMATPVMIMGTKVGLDLINQIKGLECIIIDDYDAIHTSKNIQLK